MSRSRKSLFAADLGRLVDLLIWMDYRGFEAEFLRLAFTSEVELSPVSAAFYTGLSVAETKSYMLQMVDEGVLELDSDDEGKILYFMPDRPSSPVNYEDPAMWKHKSIVVTPALENEPRWAASSQTFPSTEIRSIQVRPNFALKAFPEPVSEARATASLFINALMCPGVGSMVAGHNAVGFLQMALFMVGLPLAMVSIGLPLLVVAWVWSVMTSAQAIAASSERSLSC